MPTPLTPEARSALEAWLEDADRRLWIGHEQRRWAQIKGMIALLSFLLALAAFFGVPVVLDGLEESVVRAVELRIGAKTKTLEEERQRALIETRSSGAAIEERWRMAREAAAAALEQADRARKLSEEARVVSSEARTEAAADKVEIAKLIAEQRTQMAELERSRREQKDRIDAQVDIVTRNLDDLVEKLASEGSVLREQVASIKQGVESATKFLNSGASDAVTARAADAILTTPAGRDPGQRATLRARALASLDTDAAFQSIREHGFSLPGSNLFGNFEHDYVRVDTEDPEEAVVVDRATGLMWQQSGSRDTMTYEKALEYVDALNRDRFAGHADWRLPTIEELLSLVEPTKKSGALYIDPVFDGRQRWIRSADKESYDRSWGLVFYEAKLYTPTLSFPYYVRAVRSHSSGP